MPAAIPIAALIAGGATVYAAKTAANSQDKATQSQLGYETKALDAAKEAQTYQRGQYSNYLQRLQPYANAGAPSLDALNALLDPSIIGMEGSAPARPASNYAAQVRSAGVQPPATPPKPGMVQMKAPTGETQWVDPSMVDHYIALGAQKV